MIVKYFSPNGETITFGYDPPYGLVKVSGIGRNSASPATVRGPGQRGTTLRDIVISEKVVMLSISVMDQTYDATNYWGLRAALEHILAIEPGEFGEEPDIGLLQFIREGNLPVLELPAIPRESPQYTTEGYFYADADLEFVAPYPFPRETQDRLFNLAGSGGFEFPAGGIEFPAAGWEMPSYNVSVEIYNAGDVQAPVTIFIHGDVTNPVITNTTVGESITYTGTIAAGNRVEITTEYGNKTVTHVTAAGVRTNVMQNINHDTSRFWTLKPGINRVTFNASINNAGYANVYWRQRYGGM